MAEETEQKKLDHDFELAQNEMAVKAAHEKNIGHTARDIMLSYAKSKPGNFLSVEFAQEIRDVSLVLHGDKLAKKKKEEKPAETSGEESP